MNRGIYIAIMLVLSMSLISSELIVKPQPIEITTKVNELNNLEIELTNNFEFDIFDFTFSNLGELGFVFPEIYVQSNTTQIIPFIIQTTESFHGEIESNVQFRYFVELPEGIQTHNIQITSMGFNPDFLIARQGDTIVWKNVDEISHSISSSDFNFDIAPNGTSAFVVSKVETLNYFDIDWFFNGVVEVLNETSEEKAHNPNFDVTWNINLNSILNPTSLEVGLIDRLFEVGATSQTEGLIRIENVGGEIAEIINLTSSSDWIRFTQNNFDLPPGEVKYVPYIIAPIIFDTNQTNRTYEIELSVKSSNTEEYKDTISVFIPFSEIIADFDSDEGFLIWFAEVYCPAHPNNFLCDTSQKGKETIIVVNETEYPINVSARTLFEMKRDIARIFQQEVRTGNELKLLAEKYGLEVPLILALTNRSLETQLNNERIRERNWDMIWILGTFLVAIALFNHIFRIFKKKAYQSSLTEGQFYYR